MNREECIAALNEILKHHPICTWEYITCDTCPSAKDGECPYAYDPYNTDGDCLGVK